MDVKIEPTWHDILKGEWNSSYFYNLVTFVKDEYRQGAVYPPAKKIFAAFDACPFDKVKVVILGQDPYHGEGQANGLCFSVADDIPKPPSLVNIFKEIASDPECAGEIPQSGNLIRWAEQGVLLLNSTLTVAAHRPGSHQGHGWEQFTDAVIAALNEKRENLVFILWGSYSIRKGALIDRNRHLVLTSPHPSPLSAHRGFFGNRHFSKTNEYLASHGKTPIKWL